MIFNHSKFSEINERKLVSSINNAIPNGSELNFMDFGCGIACLYEKINRNQFVLFDQNEETLNFHKESTSKDLIIIHSLDELLTRNIRVDVVMFNSVIQYINKVDLIEIIEFFTTNFPSIKIIISDIPVHNRLLEFLYLPFTNTRDIITIYIDIVTNITNKEYKDLCFFTYEVDFFKSIKGVDVEIMNNFYLFRTRYSVVISKAVN